MDFFTLYDFFQGDSLNHLILITVSINFNLMVNGSLITNPFLGATHLPVLQSKTKKILLSLRDRNYEAEASETDLNSNETKMLLRSLVSLLSCHYKRAKIERKSLLVSSHCLSLLSERLTSHYKKVGYFLPKSQVVITSHSNPITHFVNHRMIKS